MNLETKIIIYKFTPQVFTLTLFSFCPAKNPLIYLKSTHRLALESNYICTFAYYF